MYKVMAHPEGYLAFYPTMLIETHNYETARDHAMRYLAEHGDFAAVYITPSGSGLTVACWQNRDNGFTTVAGPADAEIYTMQESIRCEMGVID